jgi:hypothetical protein
MRYTPLYGKFERKEQEKEEGKKYATAGERANRTVAAASVPLFFLYKCMCVRCRSFYSYSNCMYSEKERERERGKEGEKRTTTKSTYIHTAAKHIGQLRPMAETHACREHHPVKR